MSVQMKNKASGLLKLKKTAGKPVIKKGTKQAGQIKQIKPETQLKRIKEEIGNLYPAGDAKDQKKLEELVKQRNELIRQLEAQKVEEAKQQLLERTEMASCIFMAKNLLKGGMSPESVSDELAKKNWSVHPEQKNEFVRVCLEKALAAREKKKKTQPEEEQAEEQPEEEQAEEGESEGESVEQAPFKKRKEAQ